MADRAGVNGADSLDLAVLDGGWEGEGAGQREEGGDGHEEAGELHDGCGL